MPVLESLLNPITVENAKPREKEYTLKDGNGLFLRVRPSGVRQWIFNYRHPDTKKQNKLSYGSYPDVSLKQAREFADKDRVLLKQGIDPKIHKDTKAIEKKVTAENTFKAIALEWLRLQQLKLAPTTYKKISRYFEKDIFPLVGKYPITQITAPLGITVIQKVSGRGSQEIARKVSRAMNQVMTFAVNTGRAPFNPLAGIKEIIPKVKQENHPTLEPSGIVELMQALRYSSAKVTTRCLIEFQLHTMTRPREAAEAKWSEIDFNNSLWVIPAERMKMGRPHTIPLTRQVLDILELMKPFSAHRDYVFASHSKGNAPVNSQTANKALRDMGFTGRLVAHGLRALASTTLNEQGFDDDLIEKALAHGDENKIRKAYNRAQYLERRSVMMQWWSDWIEHAKTGELMPVVGKQHLRVINN